MQHLLFDLDGTLLNTQEGILEGVRHVLKQEGKPHLAAEVSAQDVIGPPLRESFSRLLDTSSQSKLSSAINRFRHYYLSKGIYQYQHYADIKDVLHRLDRYGYRLIVATSKPQFQAEMLLKHSHLAPIFSAVYGSDDQYPHQGKASTLEKILRDQQISAADCSMIGDHRLDIEAGKQLGMHTVAVGWGYQTPDELIQCDSDELIHSAQALLRLFPVTAHGWQAAVSH